MSQYKNVRGGEIVPLPSILRLYEYAKSISYLLRSHLLSSSAQLRNNGRFLFFFGSDICT